ncbi:DNA-binding protein WhiA [Mycoplasma sp. Mirounga ES2805-ORL]|uniref:DNA-binding protein WhiA n=1 Tax=Mycoplasma sp. Mirounga ES2805-ORL TaxID=754514 RepID=UPI00197B3668|nr:DNA-binding protein WhiA [Mycoplasma sp. Mirounga ES2805-ORL]QSF13848.1 DNA-binding protein WhiA [Mycoplasma sp. Mirounga ES2805-ORL]
MNFSLKVKNEILTRNNNRIQNLELIKGFIFSNAIKENGYYKLSIRGKEVRKLFINCLKKEHIEYKLNSIYIMIKFEDINLEKTIEQPPFFFAGVFAGGGSVNKLNTPSYHLELTSHYLEYIDLIQEKLNKYSFGFVQIKHQNKYVIYIKKHEKISDFLKAILTFNSLFNFEESIIKRDFENNVNRINNIDLSNIKKIINSNSKIINNFQFIKENNMLDKLKPKEIVFFELLSENSSESLVNLVGILNEKHNIQITKSGLYHWIKKLDKIANKIK